MSQGSRGDFVPWEVELVERAHVLRREIDEIEEIAGSANPQFNVNSARLVLDHLESDLLQGEHVSIALLGGTGSGKSTLLNALLGARLVPTSSMRACTSVITKARWSESTEYSATVQFVPRESWERQVAQLASDVGSHRSEDTDGEEEARAAEATAIPKDDQDRLRAVYGDASAELFMKTGDVSLLSEPDSIRDAFSARSHAICEQDIEAFRSKIKGYLDSSDHFWPIVESVEIAGPFEMLRCGGEIVDLPGLNDPNEAREATTRAYLESAKFVWVVFNMKRNLTKEMTDTLRSRDLLGRLLAGGRLATISLVGTASDDLDPESDCEALGLDEDTPVDDIVMARNARSVEIARDQLVILAQSLTATGGDDLELPEIAQSLLASPMFTVSARDYLALLGITRSRNTIGSRELTGIPELRSHFERIATEAGPWARAVRGFSQLELAVEELSRAVQQERAHFELSNAAVKGEREAIATSIEVAGAEFERSSSAVLDRLRRSLQQASERFDSTLIAGAESAVKELGRVTAGWQYIHWATLRAAAVRGGSYLSPTFGPIDLVRDVSTPIIDRAMSPWVAFYDRELVQVLDEANNELGTLVVDYAAAVGRIAEEQPDLAKAVLDQLERLIEDVTKSIQSSLSLTRTSVGTDVNQQRQMLHRLAYDNVAKSLAGAFEQAGRERGTGMKYRMLDVIGTAVRQSAKAEYDSVASILLRQVRMSADQVQSRLVEAVAGVVAKANEVSAGLRRVALEPVRLDDRWIADIEQLIGGYAQRFLARLEPPESLLSPRRNEERLPDLISEPSECAADPQDCFVFIDGSNLSASPGKGPDMARLRSGIDAAQKFWPDHRIITVVDRSMARFFEKRRESEQSATLAELISSERVIEPPPGHSGKADSFLLMHASERNGLVLSNDSFKERQHENPWLFDPGRLFGFTFHPALGWTFTPRFPVRPRV